MSLLVATWISAIATVALVTGASVTAWYAIKAYRDQEKQTRLFRDQAIRDIEYRRRAQASCVFVWIEDLDFDGNPDDKRAAACIRNTSNQPVYDIALGLGKRKRSAGLCSCQGVSISGLVLVQRSLMGSVQFGRVPRLGWCSVAGNRNG
jgi:hypothetical protein